MKDYLGDNSPVTAQPPMNAKVMDAPKNTADKGFWS